MKRILFVGCSEIQQITSVKGFDNTMCASYHEGAGHFLATARGLNYECDYIPTHRVHPDFPDSAEKLKAYDIVVLSNLGSNTFLLDPEMTGQGKRVPNLLLEIKKYVEAGGSLIMIGGYMAYQGISGQANYKYSYIEEVLPVTMMATDDRVEIPEGADLLYEPNDILGDLPEQWPYIFGYNRVKAKDGAQILLQYHDDPIITVGTYGAGRTLAYATDCYKHWVPDDFLNWEYYPDLWSRLLGWLSA